MFYAQSTSAVISGREREICLFMVAFAVGMDQGETVYA